MGLERLQHSVFCFFANRRPEDAPFLEELEALRRRYLQGRYWITIVPTTTHMSQSDHSWHGETGRIDHSMLARHLRSAASPIYYLGPPEMVKGLHKMLNKAGVDDDDIRSEEFAGD